MRNLSKTLGVVLIISAVMSVSAKSHASNHVFYDPVIITSTGDDGGFVKPFEVVMLNDNSVPVVLENQNRYHIASIAVVTNGHIPEVIAKARAPTTGRQKLCS